MNPYLIVGGAGFIGTALTRVLTAKKSTIFDSFSGVVHNHRSMQSVLNLGADIISGNVLSASDVDQLTCLPIPETLIYLVAETGTGRSLRNCTLNAEVNTLGLSILLDSISAKNWFPKRIVLASTRAVYGEGAYIDTNDQSTVYPGPRSSQMLEQGVFEREGLLPLNASASGHIPRPNNVYGATKLSQETLLDSWCGAFDIPLYTFRLQNVYGAGQSLTNPYTGVLVHFMKTAILSDKIDVFENGGITRDFIHVDDVASLLAQAVKGIGKPGTYDCGSGKRVNLYDVASLISSSYGSEPPIVSSNFRLGDVRHACADIESTGKEFQWHPQISLEKGIHELKQFVVENI